MALANLNITINANVAQARSGFQDFGATARESMRQSGAAVDQFRTDLARTDAQLQQASKRMGENLAGATTAIASSANDAAEALRDLDKQSKQLASTGDTMARVKQAVKDATAGVSVETETWFDKTGSWLEGKTKVLAIGLAIGAVSATAGAIYAAYRVISGSLSFVAGLFTGSSYKSQAIDALIGTNNQVKELQASLNLGAQDAHAMADALARLGVDKGGYASTMDAATKAMRTNGEELDRLGVKYKDTNGQLLDAQQFLRNVRDALESYSAGYDRNAAAAAIGAGTWAQVNDALKVTKEELAASQERLEDYTLAIGPKAQAAIAEYEQAMRDFRNETRLTGEGFSRAIADQIMPAMTELSKAFKDGWPVAVRAFRYSMAQITSLFYGLKTVVDTVTESVLGSVDSLAWAVTGVAAAIVKAMKGDMSGAKDALIHGWEEAKNRFVAIGSNITTQAEKNRDAMLLAWGMADNEKGAPPGGKGKKTWVPKPADKPATSEAKSQFAAYIEELDRMLAKVNENEYAAMRLKAAQLAQKEGITDLSQAYAKITQIQRGDSQKAVDAFVEKLMDEEKAYRLDTAAIGLTAVQTEKLMAAKTRMLAMEQAINAAKKAGKPLDDAAIAALSNETTAAIERTKALIDLRNARATDFGVGATNALGRYFEDAANSAKLAENIISGSLSRLEDALVGFVKTGKLNLGSLFSFMAEGFLRSFIQSKMAAALKAGGTDSSGGFSFANLATSFFSLFAGHSHASGLNYVPYDNYPALLHKGEQVMTAADARAERAGGGSVVINYNGDQHYGSNVSRAEIAQGMEANRRRTIEDIRRLDRHGRFA